MAIQITHKQERGTHVLACMTAIDVSKHQWLTSGDHGEHQGITADP